MQQELPAYDEFTYTFLNLDCQEYKTNYKLKT